MLSTISSHHQPLDLPRTALPSPRTSIDCGACLPKPSFDLVDNPIRRDTQKSYISEEKIIEQMKSERNRLISFQDKWPLQDITPESLASAGLFYLQQEDKVQCPFCFIKLYDWTEGDKPLREHMKRNPKCPFIMGREVGNIPLSSPKNQRSAANSVPERGHSSSAVSVSYKPKHPKMADVKRRILTYSGWPLNEPTPTELAECGLFYSGIGDVVTCFFCNGTLGNWEPDDDPWNEHLKFFPECTFVAMTRNKKKSSKLVNNSAKSIHKEPNPVPHKIDVKTSYTKEEIVKQALDIFPQDLVREAVRRKNGSVFSLQELCDTILEVKKKPQEQNVPRVTQETICSGPQSSGSAFNTDLLVCKVCMDRERGVVFQPCGHFVTCWNCANVIANCPVCRSPIVHKIRTYIS